MVSVSAMRVLEPKSTVLSHAKKRHFFGVRKNDIFSAEKMAFFRAEKMAFFGAANRTSGTTQKAQCKNITEKRKRDEKYMRENSPKK